MTNLNSTDAQYHTLLTKVLEQPFRNDRTGTGTKSIFGYQMRFEDIARRFPLLTTKKVFFRGVFEELRWMLGGSPDIKPMVDKGVNIWNDWPRKAYNASNPTAQLTEEEYIEAVKNETISAGWYDVGPCYGVQWRHWPVVEVSHADDAPYYPVDWRVDETGGEFRGDLRITGYDQIARVRNTLLTKPEDRRMIVSAWNAPLVDEMAKKGLPPCHVMFQFYTRELPFNIRVNASGFASRYRGTTEHGKALGGDEDARATIMRELDEAGAPARFLDCQVYIRSNDLLLGAPFNMAQYALLTTLMAHSVGMIAGDLVYTIGDAHAYRNHLSQINEQLSRESKGDEPQVFVKGEPKADLKDYTWEDIELIDYDAHPAIAAPIAV
ncbi:thymidylate synthase protein [Rhizobium phage RHph_N28_1]|nr:thymidylate synthase protein [Rhizobium phage RHph_N28_1]QIG74096.1 thymidylate synthase protein [Rhizobium phage RHph_N42]QIG74702.1 thymidylate synthase protein [Rhizobium phage RHph_I42]